MFCFNLLLLKAYQYLREEVKTFQGKPIKVGCPAKTDTGFLMCHTEWFWALWYFAKLNCIKYCCCNFIFSCFICT